jgi:hypothetical protein
MQRLAAVIILISMVVITGCGSWLCCGGGPPLFAGTWEMVEAENPALVDGRVRVYNRDLTGHLTLPPGKTKQFVFTYDEDTIVENFNGVKVIARYRYYPSRGLMERHVLGTEGWVRYMRR